VAVVIPVTTLARTSRQRGTRGVGDIITELTDYAEFEKNPHEYCSWLQPVLDVPMRRLYAAASSIYSNSRFASEMSKLHLMESFCLALLSYGCEVLCLVSINSAN